MNHNQGVLLRRVALVASRAAMRASREDMWKQSVERKEGWKHVASLFSLPNPTHQMADYGEQIDIGSSGLLIG